MSLTCVYDRFVTSDAPPPHSLTPHPCSCTVLYSNFSPLVIILVGRRGVNAGLLHALLPEIRLKLESVRGVVGSA